MEGLKGRYSGTGVRVGKYIRLGGRIPVTGPIGEISSKELLLSAGGLMEPRLKSKTERKGGR